MIISLFPVGDTFKEAEHHDSGSAILMDHKIIDSNPGLCCTVWLQMTSSGGLVDSCHDVLAFSCSCIPDLVHQHQRLNVLSAGSVFSGPQVLNVSKMRELPLAVVTSGRCQMAVCGLGQYYPVDSVGANGNETFGTQLWCSR